MMVSLIPLSLAHFVGSPNSSRTRSDTSDSFILPPPDKGRGPTRRVARSSSSVLWMFLLTLGIFACQASAVLISKFDNCLEDFAKLSTSRLQFHPILVDAQFDPVLRGENYLRIKVWGTVTGRDEANPAGSSAKRSIQTGYEEGVDDDAFSSLGYPAGFGDDGELLKRQISGSNNTTPTFFGDYDTDSYWPSKEIDYEYTAAIPDSLDGWIVGTATTIASTISLASFDVYNNATYFCKANHGSYTANASCPFGNFVDPANNAPTNESIGRLSTRIIPAGIGRKDIENLVTILPSFNMTYLLPSNYQMGTLAVKLRLIAGDTGATQIGCVQIEVTPILSNSTGLALTWLPVIVLILVGVAVILSSMFNPWSGTTDVFKWSSNFGMDGDMIRLVTPGFADCLQWFQFIVLTGALSLNYPGYYQPIVSKGAWSVLLLNTSFFSHNSSIPAAWRADGLYAIENWKQGYEKLSQYVGLAETEDIWVSVVIWFIVLFAGSNFLFQLWFWGRAFLRRLLRVEEQDLTRRNWPFTFGLMCRITFTYFLIPLLTASIFQLTVATRTNIVVSVFAAIMIIAVLGTAMGLTYYIWRYRPRPSLFDELTLLLRFGTFYNTYKENEVKYFIIHLYTNVLRAIAFGALQPSGIAQIVILAICEIITILSIIGIKPYGSETGMNISHTILSAIRLLTVMLMLPFIPTVRASDAAKGWIGWIILGIHASVIAFGFLFKAIRVYLELALRGYANEEQAPRGGFAKVFGVRQLSRRKHQPKQTHRSSSLTPTPMSVNERKPTLTTMSSRSPYTRSDSSAILLNSPTIEHLNMGMPGRPDGSQSGHGHSNSGSTGGFTPTSPGAHSGVYGYTSAAGPFYRPPRTRRMADPEQYSPGGRSRDSYGNGEWASKGVRSSQVSLPTGALAGQAERPEDPEWAEAHPPSGSGQRYTESSVTVGSNRGVETDYAVREMDFYYGVRGPALSSQPARRLGTGPADPTGPASTAKSWIMQKLGLAKSKEEKGFSVVRSSRAPDQLRVAQREAELAKRAAGGGSGGGDEIGVAVTSSADTSDSEEDDYAGPSSRMLGMPLSRKPTLPRKSSKRRSREVSSNMTGVPHHLYDPPIAHGSVTRLPFGEPAGGDGDGDGDKPNHSFSSTTSSQLDPPGLIEDIERPHTRGEVNRGRVSRVVINDHGELRGSQAELVRGGSESSKHSAQQPQQPQT